MGRAGGRRIENDRTGGVRRRARGVAIRGAAGSANQRAGLGSRSIRDVAHYLSTASSAPTSSPSPTTTAQRTQLPHPLSSPARSTRSLLASSLSPARRNRCIDVDRRGCDGGRRAGGGGGRRPGRGGPGGGGGCRRQAGQGQEARAPEEVAFHPRPPALRRDGLGGDLHAQGEDGVEPVRDRQVHRGQAQDAPGQLPQAAPAPAEEARCGWQAHQGQELLQAAVGACPSRRQAQGQGEGRHQAQGQAEGRHQAQGGSQAEGQGASQGQARREDQGSCQAQGSGEAQGTGQAHREAQASRKAEGQASCEAQAQGRRQAEARRRRQAEGGLREDPPGEGGQDLLQGHAGEEGSARRQEGRRSSEEVPSQEGRAGEEGRRSGQEGARSEGEEVDLCVVADSLGFHGPFCFRCSFFLFLSPVRVWSMAQLCKFDI